MALSVEHPAFGWIAGIWVIATVAIWLGMYVVVTAVYKADQIPGPRFHLMQTRYREIDNEYLFEGKLDVSTQFTLNIVAVKVEGKAVKNV